MFYYAKVFVVDNEEEIGIGWHTAGKVFHMWRVDFGCSLLADMFPHMMAS